jgi:hypothetical protein
MSSMAKSLEFLILQTKEKKVGTVKVGLCANGSVQREWMNREEVSSSTMNTE